MKRILILPVLVATAVFGHTQCPAFQLSDLQALQRTDPSLKESKIQDMGFDLRSEFISRGTANKEYSKCWRSTVRSQTVYEQLLWWNTEVNSITFFTLDENHFRQLRGSIVERNSTGSMMENPDIYVGHLFLYHFGVKKVEGVEYYVVSIEYKR